MRVPGRCAEVPAPATLRLPRIRLPSQMMSKVAVNGAEQDPLFAFLQREQPGMLGGLFGSGFSW